MGPKLYAIKFGKSAYRHLEALRRFDRNKILDGIKEQLTYAPKEKTRNKKLLRENPLADWELRVGLYRIFYDIDETNKIVRILAIGIKDRERIIIEGEEIIL